MDLNYNFINDILIVDLPDTGNGQIHSNRHELVKYINSINEADSGEIAFDMSEIEFLNSKGLGDLIRIKNSLLEQDSRLILINLSHRVKSLLSIIDAADFFRIISDRKELE